MEFVYVADLGTCVKIGYSTNVENRIKQIETVRKVKVREFYSEKAERPIEKALHQRFASFRIDGEYYSIPYAEAKATLIDAAAHPDKYPLTRANHRTEAQKRAQKAYMDKFVRVEIRTTHDKQASIQAHAQAQGESVNAYINKAIDQRMEREAGE